MIVKNRIKELQEEIEYEERKMEVCGYGSSDLRYLDGLKEELEELLGLQPTTDLVVEILDDLDFPYDDFCVNYIAENWEKDHEEEIIEDYIEIDEEDVKIYWFDYVKENLFN